MEQSDQLYSTILRGSSIESEKVPAISIGFDDFEIVGALSGDEDEQEVVVTGKRPKNPDPIGGGGGGATGGSGSGGTGRGEGSDVPITNGCTDGQANLRGAEINKAPADGLERGSIIYRDADGKITSTPIQSGAPGTVSVGAPVAWSKVTGFIHSHPPAPTTGDAALDARYDAADRYPSPADWDMMDLAVANGADPKILTFYVIDTKGVIREYSYSDNSIYDVSEGQPLGDDGYPSPPPVPEPLSSSAGCAS